MNHFLDLSAEQVKQYQILPAYNYAMNKAGLDPMCHAEPIRKELDVKIFTSTHELNPLRVCARCKEMLQDLDPENNDIIIMHNEPDCLGMFHEKCFLDFQRVYSACPTCKPEYRPESIRYANEVLMHYIENTDDAGAMISSYFHDAQQTFREANERDRDIIRDAILTFEHSTSEDNAEAIHMLPIHEAEEDASEHQDTVIEHQEDTSREVEESVIEAVQAFCDIFPHGYDTIPTSAVDLQRALRAICHSLQALSDTDARIPVPTLADLQEVTEQWEFRSQMKAFSVDGDMLNQKYFSVDQAAFAAQLWAEKHRFAIRLGYVLPCSDGRGQPLSYPTLLPYAPLSTKPLRNAGNPQIYFVFNNNVEEGNSNAINHFEGMRARTLE